MNGENRHPAPPDESGNWRELSQYNAEYDDNSPASGLDWEVNLGVKWFSRLGIVALLVGFALGLTYTWNMAWFTPGLKIALCWLATFGLFFGGTRLHKSFSLLGRILQGGGLALGYLTLYGMFFIPDVQLFTDPNLQSLGWGLLCLYVAGMIAYSLKMDSRVVVVLSLAFGYYTASFSGGQLVAFLSTGLLGIASVMLGKQGREWRMMPAIGFAGTLFTALFWHMHSAWGWFYAPDYLRFVSDYLFNIRVDQGLYLCFGFLLFHGAALMQGITHVRALQSGEKPALIDNPLGLMMAVSFVSYLLVFLTQDGQLFGIKGLAESALALTHLASFISLGLLSGSMAPDSAAEGGQPQGHLLLMTLFGVLAVMALLNADMQPIAYAGGALALGMMTNTGRYRRFYNALAGLVLFIGFVSLAFFSWSSTPVAVLLPTVGAIALAALILENTIWRGMETSMRISMMLVSSMLFLGALMSGLQSYWITFSIVLTGFAFLMSGFATGQGKYRWVGLGWMFLAIVRVLTVDMIHLETPYKIALFMALGTALLAGSYGYNLLSRKLPSSREGSEEGSGVGQEQAPHTKK